VEETTRPTLRYLLLIAALAATGCASGPGEQRSAESTATTATAASASPSARASDHFIASRDTRIPVTLVQPESAQPAPLVVFLHGHGGSRHEAGGFTQVADALAARGIASVRMDFPGCGDSTESFRNNRLQYMLADARAARDWALTQVRVDTSRMALFGFSMGGRLAMTLAAEDDRFQTLALWAPSADDGATALYDFFGGEANFRQLQQAANTNGHVAFTTSWGQDQELSAGWFSDMTRSRPLKHMQSFTGDTFVLYGNNDTVVTPAEAERVVSSAIAAKSARSHIVVGADHGLGLFSEEPELTAEAVDATVAFLSSKLGAPRASASN